jgi:hypothetical protein
VSLWNSEEYVAIGRQLADGKSLDEAIRLGESEIKSTGMGGKEVIDRCLF